MKKKYRVSQCKIDGEIWIDVIGYESVYKVSNMGRVKKINSIQFPNDIILSQGTHRQGYKLVVLSINNLRITKYVHRLVSQAFIPNPDNKPFVNHKHGIKNDNRASELEWSTRVENEIHSYVVLGRKPISPEKTSTNKLSWQQVMEIRNLYSDGVKCNILSKKYNIHESHVIRIINKKCWK